MTDELPPLERLRAEFPAGTVGKLPKPFRKDAEKGTCRECGGYHGLPAVHLDFVGHAAVTDRFLNVDPEWNWEPFSLDQMGLPALDRDGNLWIRLTVCGVTRIGVGDGPSMKERIGDALRNAAMRFGVALSLWTKDELESGHSETKAVDPRTEALERMEQTARDVGHPDAIPEHFPGAEEIATIPEPGTGKPSPGNADPEMGKKIYALCKDNNRDPVAEATRILGFSVTNTQLLSTPDAAKVFNALSADGLKFKRKS